MIVATVIKSSAAVSREQGEVILHRIKERFAKGKRITIDCTGLTCMSYRFFEPISELVFDYSEHYLFLNLRFVNISPFHAKMMQNSFEQSRKLKKQEDGKKDESLL